MRFDRYWEVGGRGKAGLRVCEEGDVREAGGASDAGEEGGYCGCVSCALEVVESFWGDILSTASKA